MDSSFRIQNMVKNRVLWILLVSVLLLFIPLIAMQFTEDVRWTPFDFVVAGSLLLIAGLLFELVLRKIKDFKYRAIVSIFLFIMLLLVWAELAVGIFGTKLGGS